MNKKFRNITFLFLACLMAPFFMALTSCNGKKNKNVDFDSIHVIRNEDTVRVLEMTRAFMELMQTNQVDSALNLLSEVGHDYVAPLPADKKEELKKQFRRMPVLEYEVKTSHYQTRDSADATYRYRFMENPTDDPNYPVHTTLTLAVQKKKGQYVLTLVDEHYLPRYN